MRILVVAHYQNDGSPTANFIHDQIKAYQDAGHEVLAIVPVAFGKRDVKGKRLSAWVKNRTFDGVRHVYLRYLTASSYGGRWFNSASAIFSLRYRRKSVLNGFQPDIIHAHTLGFDSEIGAWLKKKLGCPLVVTTHGSDTNIPLDQGRQADLKRWCDRADAVVAVSEQLKDRLATCGTQTKLHAIFNGFVPREIPAENRRTPHSMIQVGHLIPSKRVDVTIRAFAQLRKKYPDMTLTIVGQGPLREDLERLCAELGVSEGVTFTGQLPNDQVFAKLCQSQFFVMVSKPEGFGIVYLEAMAAGCVTIGTRDQGIAGVIENGRNGFLASADAPEQIVAPIEKCIEDPLMGAQMAKQGQMTASGMTWSDNAQKMLTLFEQIKLG